MIRKKGTRNHIRKSLTRSRARMVKDLDALARQEVFERDGHVCVRCRNAERAIQWAHIFSRRHICLRHEADNALTLCGGCHLWWHHQPILAVEWFRHTWPERYEYILGVFNSNQKVNVKERWQQLQQSAS